MKKIITGIYILILFGINSEISSQLYQDWKWSTPTPQGNNLRWVKMFDVNNWYAVGAAGTFIKTSNGGVNWILHHKASSEYSTSGQANALYDAHFFNMSTGIVVGGAGPNSGILRTTNAGMTFDTIQGPPYSGIFYQVTFKNNLGYAVGSTTPKIYKTTNSGLNWVGISTAPTATLYDIAIYDSLNLYVAGASGNVYITTNGGTNWTTVSTGVTGILYKIDFKNQLTGYVTGASGVFKLTTNGGLNWITPANTGITSSMYFYDLDISPSGNTIYLTGYPNYIYKSTNEGTSWDTLGFMPSLTEQPSSNTYYASDFSVTGDTLVTVGYNGLMNRRLSVSNRTCFTKIMKMTVMYDVWAQSKTGVLLAVGFPSVYNPPDGVLRSTNGGLNWTAAPFPANSRSVFNCIDMINNNTGWIAGRLSALYKTTNSGASWDSVAITSIPSGLELSKVDFINEQTGWVFSKTSNTGTIWKTTNGGGNWEMQTLAGFTGAAGTIYSASMVNANTGWVVNGNSYSRPFKTTNGGANWYGDSLVGNYSGYLYDIKMIDANTGYCCGNGGRAYKTTNGGLIWDSLTVPSRSFLFYAVKFINANTGMLAGSYGVVYCTTNGGLNWTSKNTSGGNIYGAYMASDGSAYATGLLGAVYKNDDIVTGINWNTGNAIPGDFELSQNYPNPFNPVTNIHFALPFSGEVSLKIYDITGREISSLINSTMYNPGSYEAQFDGSNLSSGIYFCSLIFDNRLIRTMKMILVK